MSPFEHGEVFVLDDGGEADLDLGNYERFLGVRLSRDHNITTGKVRVPVPTSVYRNVEVCMYVCMYDAHWLYSKAAACCLPAAADCFCVPYATLYTRGVLSFMSGVLEDGGRRCSLDGYIECHLG